MRSTDRDPRFGERGRSGLSRSVSSAGDYYRFTCAWQFGETSLKGHGEFAVQPEFDRAGARQRTVGRAARDKDRLDPSLSIPTETRDGEPLIAAHLCLTQELVRRPGMQVEARPVATTPSSASAATRAT